jgi:hypothetical protein
MLIEPPSNLTSIENMQSIKLLILLFLPTFSVSADYVIVSVKSDATDLQTKIDASAGYPKNGVDLGKGIHASKVQSQTVHQYEVIQHPVNTSWAIKIDKFESQKTAQQTPVLLTPDWSTKGDTIK